MNESAKLVKVPSFDELQVRLADVFAGIDEQLENEAALASPEQSEILAHWVGELAEKRDELGWLLEAAKHEREIAAGRRDAWASRVRFFDRFENFVKSSLLAIFQMRGLTKVSGNEFTWSLRRRPGRVQITAIEELDDRFFDYEKHPNKERIREAILAGEPVKGAIFVSDEFSIQVR